MCNLREAYYVIVPKTETIINYSGCVCAMLSTCLHKDVVCIGKKEIYDISILP